MFAKLFAISALVAAVVAQTTNVTIDQVEQAFTAANIVPSGTFSTIVSDVREAQCILSSQ